MIYYAFKNRRNGKLISGTDFRNSKQYRQILSNEYRRPLLVCEYQVKTEMNSREINPKTYKVVPVRIVEVLKGSNENDK